MFIVTFKTSKQIC